MKLLAPVAGGMQLSVIVQPGARSEELLLSDAALKVRTMAQPREGEANEAVVKIVAKLIGVARSNVKVVRGHKDRHKILLIAGATEESMTARLAGLEREDG